MNKQLTYNLSTIKVLLWPISLKSLVASLIATLLFFLYLNSTPDIYFKEIGIDRRLENFIPEQDIKKFYQSEFKTDQDFTLQVNRTVNSYLQIRILSKSNNLNINNAEFLTAEKIFLEKNSIKGPIDSYLHFYPELKNLRDHFGIKIFLMFTLTFGFFFVAFLIQTLAGQIQKDLSK